MKVWVVIISESTEKRKRMRGFLKKEDAVAEMRNIYETLERQLRHTVVLLEEVDDLLVVAFYDEAGMDRYEKAVMVELNVN